MILKNKFYEIIIKEDEVYVLNSPDNKRYDFHWNPKGYTKDDRYRTFSIEVKGKNEARIALTGNYYSFPENCAVLEENRLIVLQNYDIHIIDLEKMCLLQEYYIEDMACNFGIYRIADGYIIHGELDIKKLNLQFEKLWSFGGRDIFVTSNGKNAFELGEKTIKLYDFEDNYYEIDFDGKMINW